MRGAPTSTLIWKLNPIISGWTAYYRTVVSSEVFSSLDDYVWKLAYKWALRRHRNKPKRWVAARYFAPVPSSPGRQVGLRGPRQRAIPAQVLLDEDRSAPDGRWRGITR
jgi:hypothetical protein